MPKDGHKSQKSPYFEVFFGVWFYEIFIGPRHFWEVEVTSYESPRGSDRVKTEEVCLRQKVEGIAKIYNPVRSIPTEWKNRIIKVHAQSKNSPYGPLTSFEEFYSLGNKWTLPQAALHTAMNLEIRLRTLTVITIY